MEKIDEQERIVGLFLLPNNDMLIGEIDDTEVSDEYNVRNPIIMRHIQALVPMQNNLVGKPELVPIINSTYIRIPVSAITLVDYLGVSFADQNCSIFDEYFQFLEGLKEREKQMLTKSPLKSIH